MLYIWRCNFFTRSYKNNSIEFFASAPPFSANYIKPHAEPFALKVIDIQHFWKSIAKLKEYDAKAMFVRKPIMWELWQVIKETPLNTIDYTNYTVINDYTCDIDDPKEVNKVRNLCLNI